MLDGRLDGGQQTARIVSGPQRDFMIAATQLQVASADVDGTKINSYYRAEHEQGGKLALHAAIDSLRIFNARYGRYPLAELDIVEMAARTFLGVEYPGLIMLEQGLYEDGNGLAITTAHEVAHQWWAHQVIGANVQGSTVFSEGMAEYSALTAMEKRYGQAHTQKFLAYELDRYLSGRTAETRREMPLMLVENQPYIHYNKGSLALYALRDYISEDSMNAALSRFVRDKAFQMPPYTTAREFVGYLSAVTADSLKHVITDLFETITLWDFKTDDAAAVRNADSTWTVTLKVSAVKFRADSLGDQTEIPIRDLVDIGVFGEKQPGNTLGKPLHVEKRWITEKETTIELVVPEEPKKAGIDPYNKLIDRAPKDNVKSVVVKTG
jgi:aminopeptidase N